MVCKVCEMIVRQHFVQFWITNEIFLPGQFGFPKEKSFLSQSLPLFKYCSCGTKSKAFDRPKNDITVVKPLFLSGAQSLIPNQTNTSRLFCGDIIHLGPLFCLVFGPRKLCWDPFYSSFILTMSQGTLPLAQNSLRTI